MDEQVSQVPGEQVVREAAARMVKVTGAGGATAARPSGDDPSDWWVNVNLLVAARLRQETVRGHGGRSVSAMVLTMYTPMAAPDGQPLCVKAYDDEAIAIGAELDRLLPVCTKGV